MRQRRAILYDDDRAVLDLLTLFFRDRGYDVIACAEPQVCPVYIERDQCIQGRPCGDIMITDLTMPRMSGLELLGLQAERGCKLTARNKAILTGSLDTRSSDRIRELGCAVFMKPCRLGVLATWVRECEARMDLSRPLAVLRKEPRETCCADAVLATEHGADEHVVELVNRSGSGLCARVQAPLDVAQMLTVKTQIPLASERLQVVWTRPDSGGGCYAGMICR